MEQKTTNQQYIKDCLNSSISGADICLEYKTDEGRTQQSTKPKKTNVVSSFKKARITRRRTKREKLLSLKTAETPIKQRTLSSKKFMPAVGPTVQTARKLTNDPLKVLEDRGVFDADKIWAAFRIRRAFQLITDGVGARTTHLNDVVVQTSRSVGESEPDFEIRLKQHYTDWIDEMDRQKLQIGPVFDLVIDERSLSRIDRKWQKRKGWSKQHLCAALDLYVSVSRGYKTRGRS